MSGERYYLHNPAASPAWCELPGTFRPGSTAPVSVNLVRARGYTDVFNLSDLLPDPVVETLTGVWEAEDEARLRAELLWWTWFVAGCTQYRRADQPPDDVQGGSLVWAPLGDESEYANVTITLIPKRVKDPCTPPQGIFKEPT